MNADASGMQVTVMPNAINIAMNPADDRFSMDDYASRAEPPKIHIGEMAYYIGLDAQGMLARCVSMAQPDRKAVAALVGCWVADGITVQQVARKDFLKHLRKLEAAAKAEEKPSVGPDEAKPQSAPESAIDSEAGVPAGTPQPQQAGLPGSQDAGLAPVDPQQVALA